MPVPLPLLQLPAPGAAHLSPGDPGLFLSPLGPGLSQATFLPGMEAHLLFQTLLQGTHTSSEE